MFVNQFSFAVLFPTLLVGCPVLSRNFRSHGSVSVLCSWCPLVVSSSFLLVTFFFLFFFTVRFLHGALLIFLCLCLSVRFFHGALLMFLCLCLSVRYLHGALSTFHRLYNALQPFTPLLFPLLSSFLTLSLPALRDLVLFLTCFLLLHSSFSFMGHCC